ncbi:MAG: HlyD family efflux transporter periplasmic adaptor subunit, partial [Rhodothermales bacterium]|nr:HlyD family efflux transporter periplasmic adaptor subunit [Rhodothermales bacterium]
VLILLRPEPPTRPPQTQAPLVRTAPAEVRSGTLTVEGSGTVRALDEVQLAAEVAGKLVYVNPRLVPGGTVQRGEVLLRIDPADFENAVEQARAAVAQQQVAALEAEEEAAIAQAEYERFSDREARRTLGPYASVDADDYAARILPPDALVEPDGPAEAAAPEAAAPPRRLALREPQLRAARAALERARAQLADAALALDRTVVRAPFTGTVRAESVAPGSYVAPGQSLAEIVASAAAEVVIPLTRDEAALIPTLWAPGGRIEAAVYAGYGGLAYRWEGYVDRAQPVLNPETRTIDVVVRVPDPTRGGRLVSDGPTDGIEGPEIVPPQAPPLLVGEFVRAEIAGATLDRYVAVPRTALRPGDEIWVVRDSVLQIVRVQVVQQADEVAYLFASGIADGDPVVVSDLNVVTDGMRVRLPEAARRSRSAPTEQARLTD